MYFNFIFNTSITFLKIFISLLIFLWFASVSWFLRNKKYIKHKLTLSHSSLFFPHSHLPIKFSLWCFGTLFCTFHLIKYIHLFIYYFCLAEMLEKAFPSYIKNNPYSSSIIIVTFSFVFHLNNEVCMFPYFYLYW